MKPILKFVRAVNWKRHSNTLVKVFSDIKNLSMLALFVFIIYGIAWDTVLRPSLKDLKSRDDAIQEHQGELNEKGQLQKQYLEWERTLQGLEQDLIPVSTGNSTKVLSVSESSELVKLARSESRNEAVPVLPSPHDRRDGVNLFSGENKVVDIAALLEGKPAVQDTDAQAQPEKPVEGAELGKPGFSAEQYDYDLKVSGTYPALVDLVNQLVLQKKLVKINKIVIAKAQSEESTPDSKDYPDYPVKLEMIISLSLFLYATEQGNGG